MPEERPPRTEDFLPARKDLASLSRAAERCKGCSLYLRATQTVFGEGDATARVVVVGEQPGDYEDRQGRPFVWPAGRVVDDAHLPAGRRPATARGTNPLPPLSFAAPGSAHGPTP